MKNSDVQRIEHIQSYCQDIANAIKRFGNDYEIFLADTDYLNTVSMSIMQIGELSTGLSDDFKRVTSTEIQWGLIRGMRNMYAHAYMKMDKEAIWETATMDIPHLEKFCQRVLEQNRTRKKREDFER